MLAHRSGGLQFVIRLAVQDMLAHPVRGLQFGIGPAVQDMFFHAFPSDRESGVWYWSDGPGCAFLFAWGFTVWY